MSHGNALSTILAGLTTVALLAGCQTAMDDDFQVQPGPPPLSDPNVASVVSTVNEGSIEVARLASTRAENAAVRQYAERLVQEHRNAGERLRTLLQREGIQPAPAALTRDMENWNRRTLETLRRYERGSAFDREFIDHEVETHRWVIQALEGTLIPSTRDRELRDALVELTDHMREHLNEAQRIQRTL